MFVDASAIIAVRAEESKGPEVVKALKTHGGRFALSPMTVFESTLGLARARIGRKQSVTSEDIATGLRLSSSSARRSRPKSRR